MSLHQRFPSPTDKKQSPSHYDITLFYLFAWHLFDNLGRGLEGGVGRKWSL